MKYIWCCLVLALATQVSAQLRCIQCNNCADLPQTPVVVSCAHPPPGQTPPGPPGPDTTTPTSPTAGGDQTVSMTPSQQPQPRPSPTPPVTPVTPPAGPILTPPTSDGPGGEVTTTPPGFPPPVTDVPPTVDPDVPTFTPASNKVRRSAEAIEEFAAHFSCFRIDVQVGTATQVRRGCVANRGSNNHTCVDAANGAQPQECRLCSSNECNSSSGLIASLFLVASTVFIALKML